MKHERICVVCGSKYSYCPNCDSYNHLPRWMFSFHDENCMNIWSVINDYNAGVKTASEARAELQKLDLSKRDTFTESFKGVIAKINSEGAPVATNVEKHGMKKINNSESKFEKK